jgi:chromosome segregation ATPase
MTELQKKIEQDNHAQTVSAVKIEYKTRLDELRTQMVSLRQDLTVRETALSRLEFETAEKSEQLNFLEENIRTLETKITAQAEDIRKVRVDASAEKEDLIARQAEREETIRREYANRLEEMRREVQSERDERAEDEENTHSQEKALEEKIKSEYDRRVTELQARLLEATERLKSREEELSAQEFKLNELQNLVSISKGKMKAYEAEIRIERKRADELSLKAEKTLAEKSQSDKKHLNEIEKIEAEFRSKTEAAVARLKALKTEVEAKQADMAEQEETLLRERSELERYRKALAARWEEKRSALSVLKEKMLNDIASIIKKSRPSGDGKS